MTRDLLKLLAVFLAAFMGTFLGANWYARHFIASLKEGIERRRKESGE